MPPHDTNERQLRTRRKACLKKQLQQKMVSAVSIAMNLPLRQRYCYLDCKLYIETLLRRSVKTPNAL